MTKLLSSVLLACAGLLSTLCLAEARDAALISIIIDDLGDRWPEGLRTVALPGPVTCAVLPHTPYARALAERAAAADKEVMLHMPMEAVSGREPGPGTLRLDMSEQQFQRTFRAALASVPNVRGVNNHMGSLLTRHPGHMQWLMSELATQGGLYFVDSRTTSATVAEMLAVENALPAVRRDVFLDHHRDRAHIAGEFRRLVNLARRKGAAVAIGHPYPETLDVLEEMLPRLNELGVRMVPVSELVELTQPGRPDVWRASLSH